MTREEAIRIVNEQKRGRVYCERCEHFGASMYGDRKCFAIGNIVWEV